MAKDEILEQVLEEFGKLAKIPRKSGHEEAVSNFLRDELTGLGLNVVQDKAFNLIADMPAAKGREQAPLTILQSHMDMVCVAAEGVAYNPLTDGIQTVRTEEYLQAEGTSLGSDDGTGIAEILYILKHLKEHGPIRVIFTVDEEQGMSGAIELSEEYLKGASFLINCDSENWDVLTIGSAGSVNLDFSRRLKRVAPTAGRAFCLELGGLRGGHSGERIGDGRGNAIRTMAMLLKEISAKGMAELADFSGGTARNAIPCTAKAIIATDLEESVIESCVEDAKRRFMAIYGAAEEGITITCKPHQHPVSVLAADDKERLLQLLTLLHTGVYTMSQVVPGLVETSANLGVIAMTEDRAEVQFFPRSAVDEQVDEFRLMAEDMAALTGFDLQISAQSPGWKERKDSKLAKLMSSIFEQQNGRPMTIEVIHAGLECGWHFKKNPELDIVSIGVTTLDIHSPKERLVLKTVRPQVELIMETLRRIGEL